MPHRFIPRNEAFAFRRWGEQKRIMTEIVAVDIGGTHARFAIAEVDDGRVGRLGEAGTLKSAEHASLQLAWEHFAAMIGRALPTRAGIAVASPVGGEVIKLT